VGSTALSLTIPSAIVCASALRSSRFSGSVKPTVGTVACKPACRTGTAEVRVRRFADRRNPLPEAVCAASGRR
jgi:hypothetical protein